MHDFRGKVVLVTGGSSGIGRATALAFARAGAKVVIAARGEEQGRTVVAEIEAAGGEARFVPCDLANGADIAALIMQIVDGYGRLDCAFNNAALDEGVLQLAADFGEAEFDRVMAVNLKGVWLCMKHEIAQMLAQQPSGGTIVNTASVNGLGGSPAGALYSASKAGVLALTKSAAQDYATQGIRVNALVAGAYRTPMLESVFDRISGGQAEARLAVEQGYTQLIPLRRIGRPEEAAEAVLWLCSDAASYVTGHSMIADGGMTASFR